MAGVAPENVSRVMNDWMQRHLVTRSSDYYCIEDIAKLKNQVKLVPLDSGNGGGNILFPGQPKWVG